MQLYISRESVVDFVKVVLGELSHLASRRLRTSKDCKKYVDILTPRLAQNELESLVNERLVSRGTHADAVFGGEEFRHRLVECKQIYSHSCSAHVRRSRLSVNILHSVVFGLATVFNDL